ncbi:MAG TPA: lasso peptide biosynthesis B2 protein [Armatimonadetes bacterium]|nr:lasso peptide biosynthesis B2 protein [Armatimonadota bacterium]
MDFGEVTAVWLTLRLLLLLPLTALLVRLLPLPLTLRLLTPRRLPQTAASSAEIERLVQAVDALQSLRLPLYRRTCLRRCLVLLRLLRQRGLPVVLHFGVRRVGQQLEGHSWLTLRGELFLEPGEDPRPHYTVTYRWPEDTLWSQRL